MPLQHIFKVHSFYSFFNTARMFLLFWRQRCHLASTRLGHTALLQSPFHHKATEKNGWCATPWSRGTEDPPCQTLGIMGCWLSSSTADGSCTGTSWLGMRVHTSAGTPQMFLLTPSIQQISPVTPIPYAKRERGGRKHMTRMTQHQKTLCQSM